MALIAAQLLQHPPLKQNLGHAHLEATTTGLLMKEGQVLCICTAPIILAILQLVPLQLFPRQLVTKIVNLFPRQIVLRPLDLALALILLGLVQLSWTIRKK